MEKQQLNNGNHEQKTHSAKIRVDILAEDTPNTTIICTVCMCGMYDRKLKLMNYALMFPFEQTFKTKTKCPKIHLPALPKRPKNLGYC